MKYLLIIILFYFPQLHAKESASDPTAKWPWNCEFVYKGTYAVSKGGEIIDEGEYENPLYENPASCYKNYEDYLEAIDISKSAVLDAQTSQKYTKKDNEFYPIFYADLLYPRETRQYLRHGIMGYTIVSFTVAETGLVQNPIILEEYCVTRKILENESAISKNNIINRDLWFKSVRPCNFSDLEIDTKNKTTYYGFGKESKRQAAKNVYVPRIVDGKAVPVHNHRIMHTFVLEPYSLQTSEDSLKQKKALEKQKKALEDQKIPNKCEKKFDFPKGSSYNERCKEIILNESFEDK